MAELGSAINEKGDKFVTAVVVDARPKAGHERYLERRRVTLR